MNFSCRMFGLLLLAATMARAADPVTITVAPLQLDQSDAARTTVGKLIWRGGLVAQGRDADFGGYSGLKIEQSGRRLRAVSDTGTWLTLALGYDAKGMLQSAGSG
jgi:hypothetical protein